AVVSRGGRPDLAADKLAGVRAPTLLLVGARDEPVIELNELALGQLRCAKKLEIVASASHLFEEPGALEEVAHLASAWFNQYLIDGYLTSRPEHPGAPKKNSHASNKTKGRHESQFPNHQ
ncbi:MAG: hypothetical protein JO091_01295, partial [Acidobacteriaceae bacterium]|nr:hypothetical protein [Acidobacteriaceae bacterium]